MGALFDVTTAAERLGLSEYQVKRMYRSKMLPSRRVGRLVRFTQDDLAVFIERTKAAGAPKDAPARPGGRRTA